MTVNKKFKFRPVFWGIVLIVAAALLIIDGVGVNLGEGVNAWRIIAGALLAGWIVYELIQLKIPSIFFPLAFLFLVFEEPIAQAAGKGTDLISNWVVLLAALLLTIGFGVLMPKHTHIANANFSRAGIYYDAGKDLANACIHDNVGNAEVYITNRNAYDGSGVITVRDNLGRVRIHLPGTWFVAVQASDNIGNVHVPEQNYSCTTGITLVVKDNMGSVVVVFD